VRGHEPGGLEALPSPLRLRGNLEDDDPLARGTALTRETDAALPVLLGEVGLERARRPEELRAAAHEHLALPARASPRAEILETDPASAGGVQEVFPHAHAGAASLRLEDCDGLRQAEKGGA